MPRQRRSQYLQALKSVHDKGVLHGDIREENFVATENKVFVIDFGFSRLQADKSELEEEYRSLEALLGCRTTRKNKSNNFSENLSCSKRFARVC